MVTLVCILFHRPFGLSSAYLDSKCCDVGSDAAIELSTTQSNVSELAYSRLSLISARLIGFALDLFLKTGGFDFQELNPHLGRGYTLC
jgi:hypothetical protein